MASSNGVAKRLASEPLYRSWLSWGKRRSRLEPFKRLGKTRKVPLTGMLAACRRGTSNAVEENFDSQIQVTIVRIRHPFAHDVAA